MTRPARPAGRAFAIVTGGGTGGHVSPALAIGEALVRRGHPASAIHFVGARRGIERRLVPEAGFPLTLLPGRGIARRPSVANLAAVAGIATACAMALGLVTRFRPAVVVSVGGYAGFPVALAALVLRVPLVAVHVDAVPGAANRLVSGRAAVNAVAFAGTGIPGEVVTGPPVRSGVWEAARRPGGREEVRSELGVGPERLLVVVTGGSLGAASVNTAALEWCAAHPAQDVTVYHVAGDRNLDEMRRRAAAAGLLSPGDGAGEMSGADGPTARGATVVGMDYHLVGFEERLPSFLAACDVVVARAGASTVAELAVIGVPSVLVPLPGAPGDHQTRNAAAFEDAGAAVMIPDAECSGARLGEVLAPILSDPGRRATMAAAARSLGHEGAADRVAELAEAVARSAR